MFHGQSFWEFPPKGNFITETRPGSHFFFFARIRRAPEIPRGGGAVRPPLFAEREQCLRLRHFAFFVGDAKAVAHAEIIRRQNILPAELENQQHLHRPAPDAAHFRQPRDDFVVGQFHDLPRRRHDAGQRLFRDVADGPDFGEGKSAGADLRVRDLRQILRARKFPAGKKFFEPGQNVARRRAVELLVRDGLHERLKRRTALFRREIAFPVLADEPPHHRVAFRTNVCGRRASCKIRRAI